jgi:DNA mismatch repair protein MutL
VLYEEILANIDKHTVDGQHLLFPVQVELTAEQLAVFDESEEMLNNSGFQVAHFGGRMVNIESVPALLARKSAEQMFLKIIDDIASLRKSGHDLKKAIAQSMACRSAVMAGDKLSDQEARRLLERLLQCDNSYCCPHGRPTFIKFSRKDIDRQFGRG